MNDSKHPIEWFEARIGQIIYRAPIFDSEKNRPFIAMRIQDKNHAKLLFELQRAGRPKYDDKSSNVSQQRARQ